MTIYKLNHQSIPQEVHNTCIKQHPPSTIELIKQLGQIIKDVSDRIQIDHTYQKIYPTRQPFQEHKNPTDVCFLGTKTAPLDSKFH